jgi:hypothetical protein
MPQSTGLVQITNSWVESGGGPVQVVGSELALCMSMTIDQSLVGNGYAFDINWQVVEVATGHINNNWASQTFQERSPINLDYWFSPGGGDFTWVIANNSSYYGVNAGSGGAAERSGSGMYILRVYIFVDDSFGELPPVPGTAQWAVSDDLYFWCD